MSEETTFPSPATHTGRVAVVTGAAGGFGTAIAAELARRGADVIAVDLHSADRTVEPSGRQDERLSRFVRTSPPLKAWTRSRNRCWRSPDEWTS